MEKTLFVLVVLAAAWLRCSTHFLPLSEECTANCEDRPSQRQYDCPISSRWLYYAIYPDCHKKYIEDPQNTPCEAYAGMEVHIRCEDNATTLYHYAGDGQEESNLRTRDWVAVPARREDGGLYECRHENGSVYGQRNLTIRVEPIISVGPYELNPCNGVSCYYAFNGASCCKVGLESAWTPVYSGVNFSISVYGEEPISISVETTWNESNHYPVDLEITVFNSSTTTKNITFYNWPKTVDEKRTPAPVLVVNASNNHGYSATCFTWNLKEIYPDLFANSSLPTNQTVMEGQNATFTCHIGAKSQLSASIQIEYTSPSGWSPQIQCHSFECECMEKDCSISIKDRRIHYSGALDIYYYDIQVKNVSRNDSGAYVSCALLYATDIQWKQKAWLTVQPALFNEVPNQSGSNLPYIVAPILFVILVATVISVCGFLVVRWRKKAHIAALLRDPDTVPLTQATESLTTTPVDSNMDPAVQFARAYAHVPPLPSIEVTRPYHPARMTFMGHRVPTSRGTDTQSMDSGVIHCDSQSSSLEDFNCDSPPIHLIPHNLHMHRGSGPSGHIHLPTVSSNTKRSQSLSDLRLAIPVSQFRPRLTRVYVSYTELKIDWVIDFLKPLMERFGSTVVTVHDADMVAGQPISEERLRLILEADKVIVVVSPDYSTSEWCKYELYQAIAKQPSLTDGKVIPILCDNCSALPDVIRGVVSLRDTDEIFARKLRAALFRSHHPSH